jgi:hypothetical protein
MAAITGKADDAIRISYGFVDIHHGGRGRLRVDNLRR